MKLKTSSNTRESTFENKFCVVEDCVSHSIKEMKHSSIYEKYIHQQSNCKGTESYFPFSISLLYRFLR